MDAVKNRFLNEDQLPLVIEPQGQPKNIEEVINFVKSEKEDLKGKIRKYGGILLRGFPVENLDDFRSVMEALDTGKFVDYIGGGSPREKVSKKVYTSTEAPRDIKIHLHNEMSFANNFPSHIAFFCEIEPEVGGETFIGDSRKILQNADQDFVNKMSKKGLKYISRYYCRSWYLDTINKIQRGHRTWMEVFETNSKKEVEEKCDAAQIAYLWKKNDWLEISRLRPPFLEHPITGEKAWFNQIHLFDYNPRFLGWPKYIGMRLGYFRKDMLVDEIRYADDSPISRKEIYYVHDLLDQHSIYFPWKKGDVMILDNILTMHGRAPFKGKRRILTCMTA